LLGYKLDWSTSKAWSHQGTKPMHPNLLEPSRVAQFPMVSPVWCLRHILPSSDSVGLSSWRCGLPIMLLCRADLRSRWRLGSMAHVGFQGRALRRHPFRPFLLPLIPSSSSLSFSRPKPASSSSTNSSHSLTPSHLCPPLPRSCHRSNAIFASSNGVSGDVMIPANGVRSWWW